MISDATYIEQTDVVYVLENFKIIRKLNVNYLYLQKEYLETILENLGVKKEGNQFVYDKKVKTQNLRWVPHYFNDQKD